jgi:uncharacterized protein YecT (DUF1311 family)
VTQGVLFFSLAKPDAGIHALNAAVDLAGPESDSAKLLKARFLIGQSRSDEAAQLSLSVFDEHLDLPLTIWTCDWLVSKGRLKEASDWLLKIHRSQRWEAGRLTDKSHRMRVLAVDARIATCLWGLGQTESAIPYFKDLIGWPDLEAPLADMPQALLQAWHQGKMELEKQQNKKDEATKSASHQVNSPVSPDERSAPSGGPSFSRAQDEQNSVRLEAAIDAADRRLQTVYDQLRAKLGSVEKEALKKDEIQWIKSKDSLPPDSSEKLKTIETQIGVLEQQLNGRNANGSTSTNMEAAIAASDAELQQVYDQLRTRLGTSQKDRLRENEIKWIKWKDSLPPNSREKLETIQNRIHALESGSEER